jgi:uracil-DNA glycosylase
MPDSLRRDLHQSAAEIRGLLEELQRLGVDEIDLPPIPSDLPTCPLNVVAAEDGGETLCRRETLEEIRAELEGCERCSLCRGRRNIVFGVGNPRAKVVFVGEAPGREEDEQGEPFVGEAGRLLDRILFAMGLQREDVYICNVEKCRPPGNRDPLPEEIEACEPYLKRQLAAIRPCLIVALGRFAAQTLLRDTAPITRLRGQWRQYEGIPLMPTYHPAYLLRNPSSKKEVWEDMKQVMHRLRQEEGKKI